MATAPLATHATRNPKARETARRRRAYEAIDAAYFAGQISESARELAKWQLRVLCGVGTSFDTPQAEQARRFLCPRHQRHLSRRQIIRLNEELAAADLIWREARGTGYRTYVTAYVSRPQQLVEEAVTDTEPSPEVQEPTSDQLRQAVDQAVASGEIGQAAMLAYQLAMALARQANSDFLTPTERNADPNAPLFFGASHGDIGDTNLVTNESPTTNVKDSDIPKGDVEPPACRQGGGRHTQQRDYQPSEDNVPDTPTVQRLRAINGKDPIRLRKFAAVPLDVVEEHIQAAIAKGGGVGLVFHTLEHGLWERTPLKPDDAGEDGNKYLHGGWHKYIQHGLSNEQLLALGIDPSAGEVDDQPDEPLSAAGDGTTAPVTMPTCQHAHDMPSGDPDATRRADPVLARLWKDATKHLVLDDMDRQTWIVPARLLCLEDQHAIVGVPNIFVRQELEATYKPQIEAALSQVRGWPTTIEVVIASSSMVLS